MRKFLNLFTEGEYTAIAVYNLLLILVPVHLMASWSSMPGLLANIFLAVAALAMLASQKASEFAYAVTGFNTLLLVSLLWVMGVVSGMYGA